MTIPVLALDTRNFRAQLGAEPRTFHHALADSDLLSLEALTTLADDFPPAWTSVTGGAVASSDHAPPIDASPAEALQLVTTDTVIARLLHLELIAGYRQLALDVLGDVPRTGHSAAAFCASPRAVVPRHADGHHNLLLQITGTKRVTAGRLRADLTPGTGIYIPAFCRHSTVNDEEPSVAFSVAWSTAETTRLGVARGYNAPLRRRGLRPPAVGRHPTVDRAKALARRTLERRRADRSEH